MVSRISRSFAALGLVAAVATLGSSTSARAAYTIEYSTTGSFNGGAPGSSVSTTAGGATLTFTGVTDAFVVLPNPDGELFSNANFGSFSIEGSDYGSLNGKTFTLYITQTVPTPSGGSPADYTGTLTGTITADSSTGRVTFTGALSSIITSDDNPKEITYTIDSPVRLTSISTGPVEIVGEIEISAVPEPTTLVMAFAGLPLVGFAAWRRNRGKQV